MKKATISKGLKPIAFFLVAVILVCAFGFSADGWQIKDSSKKPSQSNGNNDSITNSTNNSEKDKGSSDTSTDLPPEPKFYNQLTGEETTEELSQAPHTAFVISPASPMYGISYSDILMEFPIENGSTRLLAFINSPNEISKIGSLDKTRGYISNLAKAFNSTVFASGNDDSVEYIKCDVGNALSTEENVKNFIYTEFSRYTYTGSSLVSSALSSINTASPEVKTPLTFNTSDAPIKGETIFNKITIPYTATEYSSLSYSQERHTYCFEKSNASVSDLTNTKGLEFANCFILFADSITYEDQNSTQMILKTIGEGIGYYFTEGTAKQIKWSLSQDGTMSLLDELSNELVINKGKSYFSFVKSSRIGDIVLS